ncbi:MAG: extracellular solute-binding protein [Cohnella sp.]|nr:extracellular solute-binding protein [Cohnella sp.]
MRRSLPLKYRSLALIVPVILAGCSNTGASVDGTPSEKRSLIRFVAAEYSSETKPFLEKLVKEFELNNPLIDVELQVANWDILDGIYTAMISKNQPPDLLNTNVYAHFAQDGLLNDFDDLLSPGLKRKLHPRLLEMDRIGGRQYALPYVATVRQLYYNKDLFARASLAKPPTTWSELLEDARRIKETGAADGFGVDLTDNETQAYLSYVFFGSGGGWTHNGEWTIDSPANVEGLTFLKRLYDAGLTDPEPTVTTRDEKQRILGEGKLGMMISGNYFASVVPKEYPALQWGIGPIPVKDGMPPVSFGVHDVFVSFKTDHTDKRAIAKFLDFLYEDDAYRRMIEQEGFLPVTTSVGDALGSRDATMRANLRELDLAKFYPTQEPAWKAVLDYARKLGDAVLYEHMTPRAALEELQRYAVVKSGELDASRPGAK